MKSVFTAPSGALKNAHPMFPEANGPVPEDVRGMASGGSDSDCAHFFLIEEEIGNPSVRAGHAGTESWSDWTSEGTMSPEEAAERGVPCWEVLERPACYLAELPLGADTSLYCMGGSRPSLVEHLDTDMLDEWFDNRGAVECLNTEVELITAHDSEYGKGKDIMLMSSESNLKLRPWDTMVSWAQRRARSGRGYVPCLEDTDAGYVALAFVSLIRGTYNDPEHAFEKACEYASESARQLISHNSPHMEWDNPIHIVAANPEGFLRDALSRYMTLRDACRPYIEGV
jgi:hypothetical protein